MAKEVHIIRHAERIYGKENLTPRGREQARKVNGRYHAGIASPLLRTQETIALITGKHPMIDARAGFDPSFTSEQLQYIDSLAKFYPLGPSAVIFEQAAFVAPIKRIGHQLVLLIMERLAAIPDDNVELICSHDGTMMAAWKELQGEPYEALTWSFGFLEGFKVTENLQIEKLRNASDKKYSDVKGN